METLGATQFDRGVLSIALIHLCNQESHVGQEVRRLYNAWKEETNEPITDLWSESYWFTLYVPHPDQQYEEMTLEAGLTQGYNIEVKLIQDKSQIPYDLPRRGHFVVVLKQQELDGEFAIAATGIFVRPLAVLSLDLIVDIVDPKEAQYQPIILKHAVIRDYPTDWEQKLRMFITQEITIDELPSLVQYVDQALNPDYRPPSWKEVYLAARGFAGV